jgi:hypothetical protein
MNEKFPNQNIRISPRDDKKTNTPMRNMDPPLARAGSSNLPTTKSLRVSFNLSLNKYKEKSTSAPNSPREKIRWALPKFFKSSPVTLSEPKKTNFTHQPTPIEVPYSDEDYAETDDPKLQYNTLNNLVCCEREEWKQWCKTLHYVVANDATSTEAKSYPWHTRTSLQALHNSNWFMTYYEKQAQLAALLKELFNKMLTPSIQQYLNTLDDTKNLDELKQTMDFCIYLHQGATNFMSNTFIDKHLSMRAEVSHLIQFLRPNKELETRFECMAHINWPSHAILNHLEEIKYQAKLAYEEGREKANQLLLNLNEGKLPENYISLRLQLPNDELLRGNTIRILRKLLNDKHADYQLQGLNYPKCGEHEGDFFLHGESPLLEPLAKIINQFSQSKRQQRGNFGALTKSHATNLAKQLAEVLLPSTTSLESKPSTISLNN